MPHLGENIRAVSMENVSFLIKGDNVGAAVYGAGTRTVLHLTAPLTLDTGAVNKVQPL